MSPSPSTHPTHQATTPRRNFLSRLIAGAATIGIATMVTPIQLAAASPGAAEMVADADTWFKKIKGKHRQVFDATTPHEGFPLAWARVFLTTNNETGTPDNELCALVILRHSAIPIAMEDRLWAKYKLGEMVNVNDPVTKAPAVRNIYWNSQPGDLPLPDMSVDQLQKRGALFCVCSMAITVYSGMFAKKMNLDAGEVKKEILAGILPGIQVVPSGVWATNRAQEHGCSYCFAG